jgi:hypothetical protein
VALLPALFSTSSSFSHGVVVVFFVTRNDCEELKGESTSVRRALGFMMFIVHSSFLFLLQIEIPTHCQLFTFFFFLDFNFQLLKEAI